MHDQNLTSSEGDQDTSACQISGHSSHAFSGKCPEMYNFTKSKCCQKLGKWTDLAWPKSNQFWRWSGYISMSKYGPFFPCVLQKMPRNHKFWPVSQSQNAAKIRKMNRPWPKPNQLWMWSGYISACKVSGHSSSGFFRKCWETINLTCFTKSKCCQN